MSVRYDISELGVMAEQVHDAMRALEQRLEQAERKALSRIRYTVSGKGTFPWDMMRYDASFPVNGDNLNWGSGRSELWEVEMEHRGTGHWEPTFDRWSSFGWGVQRDTVRVFS